MKYAVCMVSAFISIAIIGVPRSGREEGPTLTDGQATMLSSVRLSIPFTSTSDYNKARARVRSRHQPADVETQNGFSCSGVLVEIDGHVYILSAAHCVEHDPKDPITVTGNVDDTAKGPWTAHILRRGAPEEDHGTDLVLLDVFPPMPLPSLKILSDDVYVDVGLPLLNAGYLWGREGNQLIHGLLGQLYDMDLGYQFYDADLSIRPGSSGSGVVAKVDGNNMVIGIVTRWDGLGGWARAVPYTRINLWLHEK